MRGWAMLAVVVFPGALGVADLAAQDPPPLPALWGQAIGEPRLVRCVQDFAAQSTPGVPATCLELDVSMTPETSGREQMIDDEQRRWTGAVGREIMDIRQVEVTSAGSPELVLAVLFDVSGSMRLGQVLALTRTAVRGLIQRLDSFEAHVSVAVFGSRKVRTTIRNAEFGTPSEALAGQLERMREPDDENTALYTAVHEGTTKVRSKVDSLRALGRPARGAVIVLTDGQNDVGNRGDDVDLLSSSADLSFVRSTALEAGVRVIAIGVGSNVNQAELAGLSDTFIPAQVRASDLARSMAQAFGELVTGRRLTFALAPAGRLALGRGEGGVLVTFDDLAGGTRFSARTEWRPPFAASPAFMPQGSGGQASEFGGFEPGSRSRLFGLLAVLVLGWMCMWVAAPLLVRMATGGARSKSVVDRDRTGPAAPRDTRPPTEIPRERLEPEVLDIVEAPPRALDAPTLQKASLERV